MYSLFMNYLNDYFIVVLLNETKPFRLVVLSQ